MNDNADNVLRRLLVAADLVGQGFRVAIGAISAEPVQALQQELRERQGNTAVVLQDLHDRLADLEGDEGPDRPNIIIGEPKVNTAYQSLTISVAPKASQ